MASENIDYYAILNISPSASQPQIREAYKRAALQSHPDRVPVTSPERPARTRKFQKINDAYYTLSDPSRRRDYDAARAFHGFARPQPASASASDEAAGSGGAGAGFPWSAFGFGAKTPQEEQQKSDAQFGDLFEEMLREEEQQGMNADGAPHAKPAGRMWSIVGGLSGGALGFILANFPGLLAGAAAGNRLGAVRDAKGRSVYQVFSELPQAEKAQLLSQLAAKVLGQAMGSI